MNRNKTTIARYEEYRTTKRSFPGCGLIKGNWRQGESSSAIRLMLDRIRANQMERPRLLDVGAGDRGLEQVLRSSGFDGVYRSADTNELRHDYDDFLSVQESFDCIVMFEVIEHLPLETGIRFIEKSHELLQAGGLLVLSTPNPDHPCQFWRSDVTHVRPWPASSLWAILRQTGFNGPVSIYRQHMPGVSGTMWRQLVRRAFLLPAQVALSRILDIDYAQNIVVYAEK